MQQDVDQQLIKSEVNITIQPFIDVKNYVQGKLTTTDILIIKDDKLLMKELPIVDRLYSIDTFYSIKQTYEKGISKFKVSNNVDQITVVSRHRKRTYSVDPSSFGAYYLYNWISSQEYPCDKPSFQDRSAHVIYEILAMRWHKAIGIVRSMGKTLETSTLEFVLKGYQTIEALIGQEGQYYQDHFMNRSNFPITFKNRKHLLKTIFPLESSIIILFFMVTIKI